MATIEFYPSNSISIVSNIDDELPFALEFGEDSPIGKRTYVLQSEIENNLVDVLNNIKYTDDILAVTEEQMSKLHKVIMKKLKVDNHASI